MLNLGHAQAKISMPARVGWGVLLKSDDPSHYLLGYTQHRFAASFSRAFGALFSTAHHPLEPRRYRPMGARGKRRGKSKESRAGKGLAQAWAVVDKFWRLGRLEGAWGGERIRSSGIIPSDSPQELYHHQVEARSNLPLVVPH